VQAQRTSGKLLALKKLQQDETEYKAQPGSILQPSQPRAWQHAQELLHDNGNLPINLRRALVAHEDRRQRLQAANLKREVEGCNN